MQRVRPAWAAAALVLLLVGFALVRPVDHDESQYVAAAVLAARGLIPYRDFAYLQTPLQPLVLAPFAGGLGIWTYPGLRIVNALLGAVAVGASFTAMRGAGVRPTRALACAALFACCDVLLFSAGTARNDALPAALYALALPPILRTERGSGSRASAVLIGLLLAAAVATKISYALPAAAYGVHALCVRRHRPGWVLLGAAPVAALVAATWTASPLGFVYGVLLFPATAPGDYYLAAGRAWKLTLWAKAIDTIKFLALGPALLALAYVGHRRRRPMLLDGLILAGLLAALLPAPTWRQYLLPILPPLFVRLAQLWEAQPPGRGLRIAAVVFAAAGLAPSIEALVLAGGGTPMGAAMRDGRAIGAALDATRAGGAVATFSPQFVPAARRPIDPRFAAGPFHFRGRGLLAPADEASLKLVSRGTLVSAFAAQPPGAILIGGEGHRTSGDDGLDAILARWAVAHRWRTVPVRGTAFTLFVPRQRSRAALLPISES